LINLLFEAFLTLFFSIFRIHPQGYPQILGISEPAIRQLAIVDSRVKNPRICSAFCNYTKVLIFLPQKFSCVWLRYLSSIPVNIWITLELYVVFHEDVS